MVSWSQLAKYLAGEASERERKEVEHWINRDHHHLKSFNETEMYWNKIHKQAESSSIDVDAAWNNLKGKILEEEPDIKEGGKIISWPNRMIRYAAMVLLLIGLGVGGFYSYRNISKAVNTVTVHTPVDNGKKQIFLPDGSMAYLNYSTRLNYPKQFDDPKRNVNVEGEVYFDVKENPVRPFVISAKDARIEVLGTSFNVNTNFPEDKVEVYVQSGKVKLSRKNNPDQYLILEPGYKGILTPNSLKKTSKTDNNYISWATGRLIFKGQDLDDVINTLMRTYHVNIQIKDPEIRDYTITTNFTNESIDTVLSVIATTFGLEVEQNGKGRYILKEGNHRNNR